MAKFDFRYRKNLGLLLTFLIFVTLLFVVAAFFARTMTANFVETEFNNRKVEVYDATTQVFNEFFNEKVPEISYYQGYMDSVQASEYASSILRKYTFVENVTFFDVVLTNKDSIDKDSLVNSIKFNQLGIGAKTSYFFRLDKDNRFIGNKIKAEEYRDNQDDFNNMILRFGGFLDRTTDSVKLSDNDIFRIFYSIQPGKILYLNIPRMSDLTAYRGMMKQVKYPTATYDQDLFVFGIEPRKLHIENKYPNLYEKIYIKPVVDQSLRESKAYLSTELPLPGALSDYKLQFDSSESYIREDINKRFFPVMVAISVIYLILLLIAYLIYRNVSINNRLYQLQYDFINNLTHEFKTPVSVIKIAGNNIKSAENLSDAERGMYGRILDQEADKLNNLMNKLLSFAQIENKSIKFNGEKIDLEEFSRRFFEATRLKYPDLNLTYSIDVKRDMYADPVLLTSVFQNLVDNAYKYSRPDNKILDVKIQQTKKNFIILFKDEGIGIDKKEFNSIFKKFYRVKNQFNQQGSIGLGLAFCKEITEFMGGEIKVDSQINVGTIFTLIFPLDVKKT